MMYWWGGPMNGWGVALMAFGSIALWALLILGLVLVVRALRAPRGEIDDEEYEHRLGTLAARAEARSHP